MKHTYLFFLTALLLVNLMGCSAHHVTGQAENFSFTYESLQIILGSDASSVIEALGEPVSYTEEPSCAFAGMDKTYYYGSFYLSTYPLEGKDYVYRIWFADDTVATEEGIRIGSQSAQVAQIYGTDSFNGTNANILVRGNSRLTVLMEEGTVVSVQYEMVLE